MGILAKLRTIIQCTRQWTARNLTTTSQMNLSCNSSHHIQIRKHRTSNSKLALWGNNHRNKSTYKRTPQPITLVNRYGSATYTKRKWTCSSRNLRIILWALIKRLAFVNCLWLIIIIKFRRITLIISRRSCCRGEKVWTQSP